MRRPLLLLLAVLACALVAVPAANAAQVRTKAVAQDKAAVERYWTAERMRNAKPADETLAGKPPAGKGNGNGKGKQRRAATQIPPPYTSAPTSTNGKVFFSDGGSNFVCSGTAVLSPNRSTVWTAGHCVHDGASGFHTNWAFVPAYADGSRPYGTWTARRLATTNGWATAGDFSFDLGAANVSPVGGQSLTDVTGGRNVLFNTARNQQYAAHGYPAAPPFNGQRLWVCNSPLQYDDTSANPPTMGISCDMTGGSSGGGWIAGGGVTSVNSYGYGSLPNVMFGPYQGSVAQSLYTQAGSG
jgi:V8-like Glu-specific endopeptidase